MRHWNHRAVNMRHWNHRAVKTDGVVGPFDLVEALNKPVLFGGGRTLTEEKWV